MNKLTKLLIMGFLIIPFVSNAQSIAANLKYINEQFSQHNEFETSFRIDEYNKEIICEDKFGVLKAKFTDVEIKIKSGNIGIFCLNSSSRCIRNYDKNGILNDENFSEYTMGLKKNGTLIPNINTVLAKFAEIKSAIVDGTNNFSSGAATHNSGNSVAANLRYINEQFSKYNKYETSFKVDEGNREIICQDKFGILKANFADIEIRTKGNNIGIFCLNDNAKCIRAYNNLGKQKDVGYSDYTMGLRENEELIPHINMVLNKFAEIKSAILGGSATTYSSSNSNSDVEKEISKVNAIFQRSSEYKNVWRFDYAQNAIIGKTKNCEIIVPVNLSLGIKAYSREGNYGNGWYFYNLDQSIIESCTSFKNNTAKTYEYLNNEVDANQVVSSFNEIIKLRKRSNSTASTSSSSGSGSLSDNLVYINEQFRKYNAYNTVFRVDNSAKQLIWSHDFGTNYANFRDVEIRADYTNNWIGVYCLSSDKCIWQIATNGNRTDYKEYTMSLKEDGKMIANMSTVIQKFSEVKQTVLGNVSTNSNSNSDDADSPD